MTNRCHNWLWKYSRFEYRYNFRISMQHSYTHVYSCIRLLHDYKNSSIPGLVSHLSEGLVSHIKIHVREPVIKYMLLFCIKTSAAFLWWCYIANTNPIPVLYHPCLKYIHLYTSCDLHHSHQPLVLCLLKTSP